MNDIEILSKWLESLQITEEASNEYKQIDTKMLAAPATNKNIQVMLKSIVLNLGWFDRDWTKFEDWWRGIQLYLKSNRIMETNNMTTVILACIRGDVAGIYAQKKLNELDKELSICYKMRKCGQILVRYL